MILLLTQPTEHVIDVQCPAHRVATIRATAMDGATRVDDDRSLGHLGGKSSMHVGRARCRVEQTVRDDARGPVRLREVIEGPDRRDLDVEVGWKREHVEAPLIAMQSLGRTARPDADDLGEVQLVIRGVRSDHPIGDAENHRMSDELVARRRAGEERTGALGGETGEIVRSVRGGVDVGLHLVEQSVHRGVIDQAFDDRTTNLGHRSSHVVGVGVAGEPRDRLHACKVSDQG